MTKDQKEPSSSSGFCCRCGQETERKEAVGMITAWVCSTTCAYQASMIYARPSTPELDKLTAAQPFIRVMEEFFDYLDDGRNDGGDAATLSVYDLSAGVWGEATARERSALVDDFFNLSREDIESEKKVLEELVMSYQQNALNKRPE